MTKQRKYVEEATMRGTMFGCTRILLHPQRDFFLRVNKMSAYSIPLNDIIGEFSELVDVISVTYIYRIRIYYYLGMLIKEYDI